MSTFILNGKPVTPENNQKLIKFLREKGLVSVKDGCSQGACGTCTVLIDGKAVKACVQQTDRLDGKVILTVEGLSSREKAVYGYAFSEAGAVQCGFCIPGMVICAKALIDENPDPTSEEVRQAIKHNKCRCTGYKKIEEAILLAARLMREDLPVPKSESAGGVGENLCRLDARAKTLGTAKYADDYYFDGMLYGSAVRSRYPRARIISINTQKAKELEGVFAVLTAADVPGSKKIGHIVRDYDVMIPEGGVTHFLGDAVALVAAETPEILERAKALVEVEYEELRGIFSPRDALDEKAEKIHENGNLLAKEHLVRGDADEAIKNSRYVTTNHYSVPFTEHAFLEPETAVAYMENGVVRIISGDQGIYQTQHECADALGLPLERVRVNAALVGGGFGGKEDMIVQHHAALLAYKTGRPVKVSLTRDESILIHPKRHAMEMDFTTACDADGRLTAMKAVIVADTGAYASLGGPVLQRACTHAAGPYNYHNIDILGLAAYTNNPPAGAFRGFGVSQSCFAIECNINRLAEMVGISPFEMRMLNALRPGDVLPNGQIADDSTAIVETLEAVREAYDSIDKPGIACAIKNSGVGVGLEDVGRCRIIVSDGLAHVYSSAACIGQGMATVQLQVASEASGLPADRISVEAPDTHMSPDSGNTTASRQTLFTGEAVKAAALKLKSALDGVKDLSELDGTEYFGEFSFPTDPIDSAKKNPVSHAAYGYATHVVELDGEGYVKRVIAAHDVGKAINPRNIEGQIDGGVTMSLGYALTEDFPVIEGKPSKKFGTLGLFKSTMVPEIEKIIVETSQKDGAYAYGAKGIGEISAIPTAPAVALAMELRDGQQRTKLPLENTRYDKKI